MANWDKEMTIIPKYVFELYFLFVLASINYCPERF